MFVCPTQLSGPAVRFLLCSSYCRRRRHWALARRPERVSCVDVLAVNSLVLAQPHALDTHYPTTPFLTHRNAPTHRYGLQYPTLNSSTTCCLCLSSSIFFLPCLPLPRYSILFLASTFAAPASRRVCDVYRCSLCSIQHLRYGLLYGS